MLIFWVLLSDCVPFVIYFFAVIFSSQILMRRTCVF